MPLHESTWLPSTRNWLVNLLTETALFWNRGSNVVFKKAPYGSYSLQVMGSWNNWKNEKVALFSRQKLSDGNAFSTYEFSQGFTGSRLFTAMSVSPSWILRTRLSPLSPPQSLPLVIASSLFPSHHPPRAFFFPLSSPPYDTKKPLRRREVMRA